MFLFGLELRPDVVLLCMLLFVTLLWACVSAPTNTRPIVAVSVQPQKYMLEQIAGSRCDVICLLPEDAASAEFDASITDLKNIGGCSAYVMIGNIPLEQAIIGKIRNSYPGLRIYDSSDRLALISAGVHSEPDGFTWISVKNAKVMSYNMYKALAEVDPANETYYRRRLNRFMRRLDALDNELKATLGSVSGKSLLPPRPDLAYFARDYGLLQISEKAIVADSSAVMSVDVDTYDYNWPETMRRIAKSIVSNQRNGQQDRGGSDDSRSEQE